jgi:hypothetical protein
MTDAVALRPARTVPLDVTLILIPLVAAVVGLVIRYLAYAATVHYASLANFADGLCRWDCSWYVHLAEVGYDGFPTPKLINGGNWAFFPAYPLIVGALIKLTTLPTMVVATATSIAFSIGATRIAWPLLGKNLYAYTLFAVFLLAGPFSVYFTTFYTEVLFLFLTVCVFAALKERRFLLAGLFAAALSATRIVGVFIVFAILIEAWLDHRERGGTWRDFVPAIFRRPELLLSFALAPLGLFAYMAFLHFKMGDALAFQHVQRAWGRPFGLPPTFVWNALLSTPKDGFIPTSSQILGATTIIGYLLSLVLLWKRRFGMATYSLVALTLPLFAGMASMLRFVSGLAPMPLMLCELLGKNRVVAALALLLMLVGAWYGTVGWLTQYLALV